MSNTPDMATIRSQIETIAAFPDKLRAHVGKLSDAVLRFKPAGKEWSVIENVGHLIDIDVLMRGRISKITASDNPALEMLDIDASVQERGYQQKQIGALLYSFAEQRAETVERLRVLRPDAFARVGAHPTRGAISVAEILNILVNHDQAHVKQINEAIEAATKQPA
jgi:hypothetical protein